MSFRTTEYTLFEKQFGSKESIEEVILTKRRDQYESALQESPYNYDVWFDYLKMLEQEGNEEKIIETYQDIETCLEQIANINIHQTVRS